MTQLSVDALKSQAKRLRKALAASGQNLSHSAALELVSAQHGFRDWNTASAAAARPNQLAFAVGDRVSGTYLNQPFTGEVMALSKAAGGERYRVTVQFDAPVDVVTFDSFSAFRSRVSCLLRADGRAVNRLSDGTPHMILEKLD